VELHFEELPSKELETILHKRCNLPLSYSKTLVNIMLELQVCGVDIDIFNNKKEKIDLQQNCKFESKAFCLSLMILTIPTLIIYILSEINNYLNGKIQI
jgi:midasin (ATPase involved in ribosome maturation)